MTKQEYKKLMEVYEPLNQEETYTHLHECVDKVENTLQIMKWILLDMQRFLFDKGYDEYEEN